MGIFSKCHEFQVEEVESSVPRLDFCSPCFLAARIIPKYSDLRKGHTKLVLILYGNRL